MYNKKGRQDDGPGFFTRLLQFRHNVKGGERKICATLLGREPRDRERASRMRTGSGRALTLVRPDPANGERATRTLTRLAAEMAASLAALLCASC
jgi:hypothetical protein